MDSRPALQDEFLDGLIRGRGPAAVYTINGFKLKGRIAACDQLTILLEDPGGGRSLVYKSAVSTVRAEPGG